ncbi:hypothetical protein C8Q75DRAFT_809585 [Abortiporus biennis]|nr:hypothetical protein C8Q75DRAFT_809585 [Abortiporus biennis]
MDSSMPQLPVEIYQEILYHLPAYRNQDIAISTLVNCILANSVLRAAALAPSVWKPHYQARYTHFEPARERIRRKKTADDWRLLYQERRKLDQEGLRLVDQIRLCSRGGRHELARKFVREYGFDLWDALKLEVTNFVVPECFGGPPPPFDGYEPKKYSMSSKFWSTALLGTITRIRALDIWKRIFSVGANPDSVSFEEALGSLSSAFDVSMNEISAKLDDIFQECTLILQDIGTPCNPNEAGYNIPTLCVDIRAALRALGFQRADGGRQFNRLMNQFPHSFLQPGNRTTIPISLVYVFVAMARRFGIEASPANFPGEVVAHIHIPNASEDLLMDMTTTNPPVPISQARQIIQSFVGFNLGDEPLGPEYTQPANSHVILERSFSNIITFIRHERTLDRILSPNTAVSQHWSYENHETAYYCISLCCILESQNEQFVPHPPDSKPLDLVAFLNDRLKPELQEIPRQAFHEFCTEHWEADEARDRISYKRGAGNNGENVTFFCGLIYRHKQYHYLGCIYGWEPHCSASEAWMAQMNVDKLPSGRSQPFYNTFAEDGQTRYVAQDNIIPITPNPRELQNLYNSRTTFGRYFEGVETDRNTWRRRMILSHELLTTYPDDDALGKRWLKGLVPHSLQRSKLSLEI